MDFYSCRILQSLAKSVLQQNTPKRTILQLKFWE